MTNLQLKILYVLYDENRNEIKFKNADEQKQDLTYDIHSRGGKLTFGDGNNAEFAAKTDGAMCLRQRLIETIAHDVEDKTWRSGAGEGLHTEKQTLIDLLKRSAAGGIEVYKVKTSFFALDSEEKRSDIVEFNAVRDEGQSIEDFLKEKTFNWEWAGEFKELNTEIQEKQGDEVLKQESACVSSILKNRGNAINSWSVVVAAVVEKKEEQSREIASAPATENDDATVVAETDKTQNVLV